MKLTGWYVSPERPDLVFKRGQEFEIVERYGEYFKCNPKGASFTVTIPAYILTDRPMTQSEEIKAMTKGN